MIHRTQEQPDPSVVPGPGRGLGDRDGRVLLAALNATGQLRLPFADLTIDRAARSDETIRRHLAVRLAQG